MGHWLRGFVSCSAVAVGLAVGAVAWAELPITRLGAIFPVGGKAGSSVEVQIGGTDLDDVDRLLFSHAGITSEQKVAPPNPFVETPRPVPGQFLVKIDAAVPPGHYQVRAAGRFGVSNPRSFVVGTLDELIVGRQEGQPPHDSIAAAMPVTIGSTVNGRATADRLDYYRFDAKRGERFLITCAARQIDSAMDATLVLYDAAGNEIRRLHDSDGGDPAFSFDPPADGQYVLGVYDFLYRGGEQYYYRLSLDRRPQLETVFPPAGAPGSTGSYTLYGRNLPGGTPVDAALAGNSGLEQVKIDIALPSDEDARQRLPIEGFVGAAGATTDAYLFQWDSPQGRSNPVAVGYALAPVVMESKTNDAPSDAETVTLPCEFVGQFAPRGDRDWIAFEAVKGDVVWIEVFSDRMGRDTDPYLLVQKVKRGENGEETVQQIAEVDEPQGPANDVVDPTFDPRSKDPSYRLLADEDATYRVMVRDLYNGSRGDPRMTYRLVLQRSQPDFRLAVHSDPHRIDQNKVSISSLVLRRGGSAALKVHLFARFGFEGEVRVTAEGLPPGVTCHETLVGGNVPTAGLVFSAEENCAAATVPIRVVGRAAIDGKEVVRTARAGTLISGSDNIQQQQPVSHVVPDIWLSVIDKETAPGSVRVGDNQVIETSLGAKIELPVNIARRGEFTSALKLTAAGLPPKMQANEVNVEGAEGKFELQLNNREIMPGAYTFFLRGSGKFKYARNPDAVQAAEQEQQQIEQIRKDMESQANAANEAKNAATSKAAEMANRVQQAQQAVASAQSEAQKAAEQARQAAEKLKADTAAAQQDPQNQALADAVKAAQAAATDSASRSEQAAKRLAEAESAQTTTQNEKQAADAAKQTAEQAATEAMNKKNQAEELKRQIDQKVAEVKRTNEKKDVDFAVESTPIRLRVVASPVTLRPTAPAAATIQGEKVEIPVAIERKYGFDDNVTVRFEPPGGIGGFNAVQIDVAKGTSDGKLEVPLGKEVPPGEHRCKIVAKLRFNNVELTTSEEIVIQVAPAPPQQAAPPQ